MYQPGIAVRLDIHLVVDALEDQVGHGSLKKTGVQLPSLVSNLLIFRRVCRDTIGKCVQLQILRPDDNVNGLVAAEACVDTGKTGAEDLHQLILHHCGIDNVGISDKVRDKRIRRLVVDILRCSDLLDIALIHDDDRVRHGQRFFLVMGDIDEGNPKLILKADQFILHILSELEIECPERFVKQKHLRLIHDGARNCDPLLLAAGQGIRHAVLKSLQVYEPQCIFDFFPDIVL